MQQPTPQVRAIGVVREGRVGDLGGEAEAVVQEATHGVAAQQGGVELDRGVQPPVLQQMASDALDLVVDATHRRRRLDRQVQIDQLQRDLEEAIERLK